MEELLQMLRDVDLPKDGRDRVHANDPENVKRGMALGTVVDYAARHLEISVYTKRHKMLARALMIIPLPSAKKITKAFLMRWCY
jgi:hypothetical protein